jgi:hypothetical protein
MRNNKFLSIGVALVALALAAVITPRSADAQQRLFGYGTATSTAAAATINHTSGLITTEALTTAGLADYTFTLTNSTIESAGAVVVASISYGTNSAGTPVVQRITPAAGSCVIIIRNQHATVALNGTIKIAFAVLRQ